MSNSSRRGGVSAAFAASFQSDAWTVPWPFRDSEWLRAQIGKTLTPLQADFARCLAMSAWAAHKPMRMLVFGLAMHSSLDDALLACLRLSGWPFRALDDPRLDVCWDSRWEFIAATDEMPARYQQAPSYHDRLRLELLLDAWERATLHFAGDGRRLDPLADALAGASAAFSQELALPPALLRKVADERRLDIEAERQLRLGLHDRLEELPGDDIRHLAITGAFDGWGDIDKAVSRYGTESMRSLLRLFRDLPPATFAREELEPMLMDLRRNLWAPFAVVSQ
ncbi:MAG: hypothetical protein ACREPX_02750 [Rhodanobacteraceae bacterium]